MLKFSILFILVFLSSIFVACNKGHHKKVMSVGVIGNLPPFHFKVKGQNKGLDIELLNEITCGLRNDFKLVHFNSDSKLLEALESRSIDLAITHLKIEPIEIDKFKQIESYYQPSFALVFNKSELNNIDGVEDVYGTIGARDDSLEAEYMLDLLKSSNDNRSHQTERSLDQSFAPSNSNESLSGEYVLNPEVRTVLYKDNIDGIHSMRTNQLQFLILESLEAELIVKNNKDLTYVTLKPDALQSKYYYGFLFKKGSKLQQPIHSILKKLEDESKMDVLKLRWLSGFVYYGIMNSKQSSCQVTELKA